MMKFLLEKEFKSLLRNSFYPRLIIIMPVVMMIILPFAANMEVKNINISVVDGDHTMMSQKLIQKMSESPNFHLKGVVASYEEALLGVEEGEVDVVVTIPKDFEKNGLNGVPSDIFIATNATNATKAMIGGSYMSEMVAGFAVASGMVPHFIENCINVVSQYRFNSYMDYKVFMVPALIVILLTIMCGFLPALNIVGEKEKGTIEQMNVSPVGKFTFIFSKLIPFWIIGFVIVTISFGVAFFVYHLIPAGGFFTIYVAAALFFIVLSGFGLVVSNHSQTIQQAMFVMFFFLLIFILLSGIFAPISSMPQWTQNITMINPLSYFIRIMRGVYLKGSGLSDISGELLSLSVFAILFNTWAVISYKKHS